MSQQPNLFFSHSSSTNQPKILSPQSKIQISATTYQFQNQLLKQQSSHEILKKINYNKNSNSLRPNQLLSSPKYKNRMGINEEVQPIQITASQRGIQPRVNETSQVGQRNSAESLNRIIDLECQLQQMKREKELLETKNSHLQNYVGELEGIIQENNKEFQEKNKDLGLKLIFLTQQMEFLAINHQTAGLSGLKQPPNQGFKIHQPFNQRSPTGKLNSGYLFSGKKK